MKAETQIARRRVRLGLTQVELAKEMSISVPTLRRLERSQLASPPLYYLVNAAEVLGCHWHELVEPEWEKPRNKKRRGDPPLH